MRIALVGRGPLAEPITRLAERAGHTVIDVEAWAAEEPPDLVILAGSRAAVEPLLGRAISKRSQGAVIIDIERAGRMRVPTERERQCRYWYDPPRDEDN